MTKRITAVIAESGAYHDLQIAPGTTARDIRGQLGLSDSYLISKRGGQPFGDDENIYGAIADGEKLLLSTPVEVGIGGFRAFRPGGSIDDWLENVGIRQPIQKVAPASFNSLPSIPTAPTFHWPAARKPILVQRDSRPIWEQRGWTRSGDDYHGYYRTKFGSWNGKAKVSPSGRVELFIRNPPTALESHEHWICFRQQWGGWYFIHTNSPVADLSSGILAVEQILNEAHI
ncbi:MAG: hypothetical protein ACXWJX_14155 [Limisphaerales bacterium]